ncbi:hypothetical protein GCM10010109_18540 [Actinoplanes campanulatus]|nr:hypothetical protein GCM10010109_18540 [Actinoplanes campanulatus]GID36372.1 hypothetical protein Aca09nite_28780 [Actinoplanes campanulatus]
MEPGDAITGARGLGGFAAQAGADDQFAATGTSVPDREVALIARHTQRRPPTTGAPDEPGNDLRICRFREDQHRRRGRGDDGYRRRLTIAATGGERNDGQGANYR